MTVFGMYHLPKDELITLRHKLFLFLLFSENPTNHLGSDRPGLFPHKVSQKKNICNFYIISLKAIIKAIISNKEKWVENSARWLHVSTLQTDFLRFITHRMFSSQRFGCSKVLSIEFGPLPPPSPRELWMSARQVRNVAYVLLHDTLMCVAWRIHVCTLIFLHVL